MPEFNPIPLEVKRIVFGGVVVSGTSSVFKSLHCLPLFWREVIFERSLDQSPLLIVKTVVRERILYWTDPSFTSLAKPFVFSFVCGVISLACFLAEVIDYLVDVF